MATYNNVYRTLEGKIVKETPKAILFNVIDKETLKTIQQDWFPKSQLSSYGGAYDEIDGTFNFILASEWILKEKNLLDKATPIEKINTIKGSLTPNVKADTIRNRSARGNLKDDEGQPDWEDPRDMPDALCHPELAQPTEDEWNEYMNSLSEADRKNED